MTRTSTTTDSRERLLSAAEHLFSERGYHHVSMRDIAQELGIKQASLYHHAPGGKEQLFVEATERSLKRHRDGLSEAISTAFELEGQLEAAARWLTTHSPLNLQSMLEIDMKALSPDNGRRLTQLAYQSLFGPLIAAFEAAGNRGEIRLISAQRLAGAFIALMDGISYVSHAGHTSISMDDMAKDMIDIVLNGIRAR
jgi:AcrR family transcriptional regulator